MIDRPVMKFSGAPVRLLPVDGTISVTKELCGGCGRMMLVDPPVTLQLPLEHFIGLFCMSCNAVTAAGDGSAFPVDPNSSALGPLGFTEFFFCSCE